MQKENDFFSRNLNGAWTAGTDRDHMEKVAVPGLAGDPAKVSPGPLWYSRQVTLPAGDWTNATLVLKGARFMPAVYVDGEKCSSSPGGMAPTFHPLRGERVRPGQRVRIEVELQPLDAVPECDASRIPDADLWRSNISSCLWDDVILRCHGPARIARMLPSYNHDTRTMDVRWRIEAQPGADMPLAAEVIVRDESGNAFLRQDCPVGAASGTWTFEVPDHWPLWTPDDPARLQLQVTLKSGGKPLDRETFFFGLRDFRVRGLGFTLNGEPCQMRAGTVVWHRWTRDPESRELAFDTRWFRENIVEQLLARGANTLRFHLGQPPEALLDLCDEAGLTVQAEWLFFHGIKASRESMAEQWTNWLDLALRHPSVVLVHPWNETESKDETGRALEAIRAIEPLFPPFVVSHRDVIHLHRYWWSLFEDLGLDYDSPAQFDKPVIADEFGGNYLDGDANPGLYPAVKGSFLRFLGRNHTAEDRLTLHRDANARIAEYWRRTGVAGFSPFCMLGSREDGNHHFMGLLRDAIQKPVWDALTAAYSPVSCSLELWDRNFLPGSAVTADIHLFNDTPTDCEAVCLVHIEDCCTSSAVGHDTVIRAHLGPRTREVRKVSLPLPDREGDFLVTAVLVAPSDVVDYPVVSFWQIRTLRPAAPSSLSAASICVPGQEPELISFLAANGISTTFEMAGASAVLFGGKAWERLPRDPRLVSALRAAIDRGTGVVFLDAGPREDQHMLGKREGGVKNAGRADVTLFDGLRVTFTEGVEGESCVHPAEGGHPVLWQHVPTEATRIWNGRRGGLIVPAWDMQVSGLARAAFLACWRERGAPVDRLEAGGGCVAYELAGHYAFSETDDKDVVRKLREKVKFLADDAPALGARLDPDGPVAVTDLAAACRECPPNGAETVRPLACAGKGLVRAPVVEIGFGGKRGTIVVSQLYTEARLVRGAAQPGLYGTRHDPAAEQFVLNMLAIAAGPGAA